MIFEFSDDIESLKSSNPQAIHNILNDLLCAHRSGHHLVIIDRVTIDWLTTNIDFNHRDQSMLRLLRSEYTQTGNIIDEATSWITIKPSHIGGATTDGRRIILGVNDADWRYLLQRPNLLIENSQYDGTLIETILGSLRHKVNAPNISFDKRNGGGSGIFQVWEQQIAQGYIVCLIADSDKRHPDASPSENFAKAIKFAEERGSKLAYCLPLPCLEAENLVPLSIIEALPCSQEKAKEISTLKKIDRAEENSGIEFSRRFILFFDFKKGIRESCLTCRNPQNAGDWYRSRMEMGGSGAKYAGFSEDIISQLIADEKLLKQFSREISRNPRWLQVFGDFFAHLCWIGYAPRQYAL